MSEYMCTKQINDFLWKWILSSKIVKYIKSNNKNYRPSVAGAVLQTELWFIDALTNWLILFRKSLQNTFTPKPQWPLAYSDLTSVFSQLKLVCPAEEERDKSPTECRMSVCQAQSNNQLSSFFFISCQPSPIIAELVFMFFISWQIYLVFF